MGQSKKLSVSQGKLMKLLIAYNERIDQACANETDATSNTTTFAEVWVREIAASPQQLLHPLQWARSIQPKFPEISVQNSMDRFGPTGKVSKKRVHFLRWTTFPGWTGWNFGSMDRAQYLPALGSIVGLT